MTDADREMKREGSEKRPYESPAIEDTANFETLALTCAKTPGDAACNYGPRRHPTQS